MNKFVIGTDLGGTTVKLGVFDTTGRLLEKWEIPTRTENNGSDILSSIDDSIHNKIVNMSINKKDILGIGLGVPGPVTNDGIVHKCINIGWDTFNVSHELENILELPVKVGNDATIAALGEMWQGGGTGYENVVLVTLGTGVGGGIVINGNIVYGSTGSAGEIGHMHIDYHETEKCNCGNTGCLEQYASATGIVRMCRKLLATDSTSSTLRNIKSISAKDIFNASKAGDELAARLTDQYCNYLGLALSQVAVVVNPEIFVIGGGVSKAGSIITEGVKKYFRQYAHYSCVNTEFQLAKLGNDAGIYGAAKLIL